MLNIKNWQAGEKVRNVDINNNFNNIYSHIKLIATKAQLPVQTTPATITEGDTYFVYGETGDNRINNGLWIFSNGVFIQSNEYTQAQINAILLRLSTIEGNIGNITLLKTKARDLVGATNENYDSIQNNILVIAKNSQDILKLEKRGTYVGTYPTEAALFAARPAAQGDEGDFAYVNTAVADEFQEYVILIPNGLGVKTWEKSGTSSSIFKAEFGDGEPTTKQDKAVTTDEFVKLENIATKKFQVIEDTADIVIKNKTGLQGFLKITDGGDFQLTGNGNSITSNGTGLAISVDNSTQQIILGAKTSLDLYELTDLGAPTKPDSAARLQDIDNVDIYSKTKSLLRAGTNVTINADDLGRTLTINSTGGGSGGNLTPAQERTLRQAPEYVPIKLKTIDGTPYKFYKVSGSTTAGLFGFLHFDNFLLDSGTRAHLEVVIEQTITKNIDGTINPELSTVTYTRRTLDPKYDSFIPENNVQIGFVTEGSDTYLTLGVITDPDTKFFYDPQASVLDKASYYDVLTTTDPVTGYYIADSVASNPIKIPLVDQTPPDIDDEFEVIEIANDTKLQLKYTRAPNTTQTFDSTNGNIDFNLQAGGKLNYNNKEVWTTPTGIDGVEINETNKTIGFSQDVKDHFSQTDTNTRSIIDINGHIGTVSDLQTTEKILVPAINELNNQIGIIDGLLSTAEDNLTAIATKVGMTPLNTTAKDLSGATNELKSRADDNANAIGELAQANSAFYDKTYDQGQTGVVSPNGAQITWTFNDLPVQAPGNGARFISDVSTEQDVIIPFLLKAGQTVTEKPIEGKNNVTAALSTLSTWTVPSDVSKSNLVITTTAVDKTGQPVPGFFKATDGNILRIVSIGGISATGGSGKTYIGDGSTIFVNQSNGEISITSAVIDKVNTTESEVTRLDTKVGALATIVGEELRLAVELPYTTAGVAYTNDGDFKANAQALITIKKTSGNNTYYYHIPLRLKSTLQTFNATIKDINGFNDAAFNFTYQIIGNQIQFVASADDNTLVFKDLRTLEDDSAMDLVDGVDNSYPFSALVNENVAQTNDGGALYGLNEYDNGGIKARVPDGGELDLQVGTAIYKFTNAGLDMGGKAITNASGGVAKDWNAFQTQANWTYNTTNNRWIANTPLTAGLFKITITINNSITTAFLEVGNTPTQQDDITVLFSIALNGMQFFQISPKEIEWFNKLFTGDNKPVALDGTILTFNIEKWM